MKGLAEVAGTGAKDQVRSGARAASKADGYADRPVVKPPVWTWEVPVYFFVGGIAGMSMVIAAVTHLHNGGGVRSATQMDAQADLVRSCLWVALLGALISPALLISDLGRPRRFLNMLRRFNPRSPMSMGVWILMGFSGVVAVSLLLSLGEQFEAGGLATLSATLAPLQGLILGCGAVLGALLATYTGVLLGVSAIPVWQEHRRLLPIHFGVASLGGAASVLIVLGHSDVALTRLMWIAVAAEVAIAVSARYGSLVGVGRRRWLMLPPSLMTIGPGVLLASGTPLLAGLCFLVGSLLSRFAWLELGRLSALRS